MPNFSVGTEPATVAAIEAAAAGPAALLDRHSDDVHRRTVLTLGGRPGALEAALLAAAQAAIERIDLRTHDGAHPRVGAIDVCPVVFPVVEGREPAEALAAGLGPGLGSLGLPVFLYGALATSAERRERHFFRRGGIEALTARMGSGELAPDFGPRRPHPSAGAVLLTARPPLAAFNLELEGASIDAAAEIAAGLREGGGGLPGVRAIAIDLGRGRIQVSTNVHDPVAVPLAAVVDEAERLAARSGGRLVAAEIVGLVPERALLGYPARVPISGFDPDRQTIESGLAMAGLSP